MYDKNSVTAIVHEDTVKNVVLTDVRYYLLICQQVSHSSLLLSVVKIVVLEDISSILNHDERGRLRCFSSQNKINLG